MWAQSNDIRAKDARKPEDIVSGTVGEVAGRGGKEYRVMRLFGD